MNEMLRVWDPFIRLAHWILVAGFGIAYLTEDDQLTLHVWAGYAVGIVIVLRIIWGFIGPARARFTDFLYAPGVVVGYLRDLLLARARRYVGHSPGGGIMIIALLLGVAGTVLTGLFLHAVENHAGPLAPLYAGNSAAAPGAVAFVSPALADEREGARGGGGKNESEVLEGLHEFFANLTLGLIIAHVCGVLLASFVHRENLILAMITGRKRSTMT
jgi:cytochrome b